MKYEDILSYMDKNELETHILLANSGECVVFLKPTLENSFYVYEWENPNYDMAKELSEATEVIEFESWILPSIIENDAFIEICNEEGFDYPSILHKFYE